MQQAGDMWHVMTAKADANITRVVATPWRVTKPGMAVRRSSSLGNSARSPRVSMQSTRQASVTLAATRSGTPLSRPRVMEPRSAAMSTVPSSARPREMEVIQAESSAGSPAMRPAKWLSSRPRNSRSNCTSRSGGTSRTSLAEQYFTFRCPACSTFGVAQRTR